MARPLRIEFPGAVYHITSRGNSRSAIYLFDSDRNHFLELLDSVCRRFHWVVYAYCLMGNHYHLVVETVEGNLSCGMRQLNGVYTQGFNRRHERCGHVLQGRYTAILVDKEEYLLELIRYVLLNPVRAGMVRAAGQYPWSSYRAMIGRTGCPDWLAWEWVLRLFDGSVAAARRKFIRYLREGRGQTGIWDHLRQNMYLGDETFVARVQQYRGDEGDMQEIPRIRRRDPARSLVYYAQRHAPGQAMRMAYATGLYTLREIAEYFGLHYSTVSRAVKKVK